MKSITVMIMVMLAKTDIGNAVDSLWNSIYQVIKEVGGTLAIATFVCSAFYYFILGTSKNSLETAKRVMVGAAVGIIIIYLGPVVIQTIISVVSGL